MKPVDIYTCTYDKRTFYYYLDHLGEHKFKELDHIRLWLEKRNMSIRDIGPCKTKTMCCKSVF